jgi:hypothetical protein
MATAGNQASDPSRAPFNRISKRTISCVYDLGGLCEDLQSDGRVIGLFINERQEFLEFRHLVKEFVSGVFQLFGE